ncbi:MAG: hypothetical protein MK008_05725 [Bdellovibrionales bacterium]|nr:hypothetical protein [Bdellovibrionales bacterium]
MKAAILFIVLGLFSFSSQAKTEMSFLDVYVEPLIDFGMGKYEIGESPNFLDEGSFNPLSLGGRLGLKLGPVFVGFDYYESGIVGGSSEMQVSSTNRERYPKVQNGTLTSIGPSLGVQVGRAYLWGAVTAESLEQDLLKPEKYEHEYEGTGVRISLDFDIFKSIHAGFFYHSRSFDKYTSTLSTDTVENAELPNELNSTTYGIKLSYFFSISQVPGLTQVFK